MDFINNFIQTLKPSSDPIAELISSRKPNKFSILRTEAENVPEKLIKNSKKLPEFLKKNVGEAHLHSYFVDHKEHFEKHFHESVFIAGESNIEISIQKHTLLQKIFLFNNSKAVIDFRTHAGEYKILQVHLYDEAEVYIDAGNNVDIFVRFLSGKAKANVKTDISCTLVKSNYNSSGLIKSVKVEPEKIIYYDSTGIIKSVKIEPEKKNGYD